MDAKQFLAEFGHIANAPGGVEQLRQMIYNLAITGTLVPQQAEDGDARELLEQIGQTRQRLIQAKVYKRLPKLESEPIDVPGNIVLPPSWCWTRLLDVGEISPRNEADDNELAAFIPMSGISQLHRGSLICETRPWGEIKKGFTHFANGDVVVAKITPCFENGKAAIICGLDNIKGIGAGTTELHVFRSIHPHLLPEYVYLFLRSPYFCVEGEQNMTGTAGQKRLPTEYFATRAMPLPPHKEQQRIVAKVDELMALCDKLELQQQQRRSLQNNLRLSTLQAVVASTSPHELQLAWTFLEENFSRLFQVPEDIDEFIANLKNLAVLGLLARVTNDQPDLSEIVSACSALRSEYVSAGLMRKQKLILNVDPVELNYPEHWAVVPFDEVAVVIGGVTKGRDLRGKDVVTCPYLSVANVQRGFFKLDQLKSIQITKAELTKYQVLEGDLLITEGGDWDKVGRTAIWKGGIDNCLHQNHVFKARVPSELLLNEWVELIFNSGIGRNYFAGASKQTTNLASINMTQLRSFPLPIPPLAEQRNILKNLDAMTAFCQSWRNQLEHKQKLAALFATAVTSSFTGIRTQEEEQPLKAPKTELIAPLRLGTPPSTKEQAPLAAILAHQNGEMAAKDLWQRFGGEIDAFYAQLKLEVDKGWILEPEVAKMRQLETA